MFDDIFSLIGDPLHAAATYDPGAHASAWGGAEQHAAAVDPLAAGAGHGLAGADGHGLDGGHAGYEASLIAPVEHGAAPHTPAGHLAVGAMHGHLPVAQHHQDPFAAGIAPEHLGYAAAPTHAGAPGGAWYDEGHMGYMPDYIGRDGVIHHHAHWDSVQLDRVGTPMDDGKYWHYQEGNNSCAIAAQTDIINSLTHGHVSESEVARYAEQHGWYSPRTGTQLQNMSKVVENMSVGPHRQHLAVESHDNASAMDIYRALQHGDKVAVGLNAAEIWNPLRDPRTGQPIEQHLQEGHEVEVTGMYRAPDGTWKVILCDTGIPNGATEIVDLADFQRAWADYGDHMVAIHTPGTGA